MKIPSDSNLHYMPLVYLLPEDMMEKCPTLRTLPRKIREIMYNEKMRAVVESDQFYNEIANAMAALTFPHFGFGGWKEHYTGDSPVWKLTYALPIWARVVKAEIGSDLQELFLVESSETIPFVHPDDIGDLMSPIVKRAIEEEGWQPILDIVKGMPCDEDFENWKTNVRTDFLRKWYHTRSKKVQMISLDACLEDKEYGIYEVEDKSANFEDRVAAEDFFQRFKAQLSPRDREVLALRVEGVTYEEIADKLGYKNHSGVIKRIRAIEKEFTKYEEAQR